MIDHLDMPLHDGGYQHGFYFPPDYAIRHGRSPD